MKKIQAIMLAAISPAAFTLGQDDSSSDEDVFELSPFEVVADDDVGYASQKTLSGSRLRTELKDVAAAISPMTAELLEDIAATNVMDAAEYAMNTRVDTDDGRTAGPIQEGFNDGFQNFRIRGLGGAERRLNFMPYFGSADGYMTQRLEINRGPNSILYGIGSAAGVINVSTKQAQTNRRSSSVSLRLDSWGGFRSSFDTNIPIIEDTLAVRVAGLHSEEESWRTHGHNDQERIFLNAKWRPSDKTSLTVEYETGDQDRYNPRPSFGVDNIGRWVEEGMPIWDPYPNLPNTDPDVGVPNNPTRENLNGLRSLDSLFHIVLSDQLPHAQDYRRFAATEDPLGPRRTDFERGLTNPDAAVGANWVSGQFDSERHSFTLQHEFMEGLNAEVALAHQRFDRFTTNINAFDNSVQFDPNLHFPNGDERVPFEDPSYYFEARREERPGFDELDYLRATLSYEKEIGELGLLRVAGMFESQDVEQRSEILQQYLLNGPSPLSGGAFRANPEDRRNQLFHRFHIDAADLDDPNLVIPPPNDVSDGVVFQDPVTGELTTVYAHMINRNAGNINWLEREQDSKMIAGQFYTLNRRLVLTGGYRWDDEDRFQNQAIRDPNTPEGIVGPWIPVAPPDEATATFSGETYTFGGVYHINDTVSVFANHSNSVSVPATFRVAAEDPEVVPVEAWFAGTPEGVTDDFGVKLSLLDDKLFITGTIYETSATNDAAFSGFGAARGRIDELWTSLINSGKLTAEETAIAEAQRAHISGVQAYQFDAETEGFELEVVGKLSDAWTVTLNLAHTESVRTNSAPRFSRYVEYWSDPARGALSWLGENADLLLAQDASTPGPDYKETRDFRTAEEFARTGDATIRSTSNIEQFVDVQRYASEVVYFNDNVRFIGEPKYNLNIRTRYDFREGALKGFRLGGGMRLREGRVGGNLVDATIPEDPNEWTEQFNGRTVNSITQVEAEDQAIFDLMINYRRKIWNDMDWSIQLNIQNLFDEDEFIVNNADITTGEFLTYRYQDPRRFLLTNTISF